MNQGRRASDADISGRLPAGLELAFQPLHKRAFGAAIGLAFGVAVAAATVIALLRDSGSAINLQLLQQYFYGYSVSWPGAAVGFGWAFFVGFTAGWFVAFCRNIVLAVSLFLVRTRAELFETRDFLDHI
jgi:hypothetical protein